MQGLASPPLLTAQQPTISAKQRMQDLYAQGFIRNKGELAACEETPPGGNFPASKRVVQPFVVFFPFFCFCFVYRGFSLCQFAN